MKDRRKPPTPPRSRIGDAPLDEIYAEKMERIARALDHKFNHGARGLDRKTAFVLMVFPFGEHGRCNYISNGRRDDIILLLEEQLKRFRDPTTKGYNPKANGNPDPTEKSPKTH